MGVLQRGLRGLNMRAALAVIAVAACSSAAAPAEPYLTSASYRRATLEASLVNPDNGYSRLRLASYESGDARDWSRLPEWNPSVASVALDSVDVAPAQLLGESARPLAISDAAAQGDEAALLALGEEAFFRYPVQRASVAEAKRLTRSSLESYGFWTDDARGAGGLVRVTLADGTAGTSYTCSTCHAASRGGALAIGVGNDRLDLGKLQTDALTPELASRGATWGPGRIDVTTEDGREPVRIADLRPVRWLTFLHADASVAQRDRATLAIRIETLLVTAHHAALRPPRAIALGLAAYVWSLADHLPAAPPQTPGQVNGARLFQAECARCHAPPALTGPPVALETVGTDPMIGRSSDRTTGAYRVPSLHGVSSRGALLHDASLPGLDSMFDPSRVEAGYGGGRRGPGAIPGHTFGLGLTASDRADLLAFLATL